MRFAIVLASLAVAGLAFGDEFPVIPSPDQLEARKLAQAPKIDGSIEDSEWAGASSSQRTLIDIGSSQATTDRGKYWIGYDDQAVYFAVRTWLAEPNRLVADEFRDNVSLSGNDSVTFYLDVMGSTRDFSTFTINPQGALQIDISGGRAAKTEWRGECQGAARRTDFGWEAEIRIPWDILPLPQAGRRDIRYLADWFVSARQRGLSFHSTQGDFSKMHTLTGVEIPPVITHQTLRLMPYGYTGFDDDGRFVGNAGLDMKTSLGGAATIVGTINPDFRNIENDILSLDFSNFERLAAEVRPFFLEGRDFRRTGFEFPLFASQRIQRFDAGMNVYGNLGPKIQFNAIAALDTGVQDAAVVSTTFTPEPSTLISSSAVVLQRPGENNLANHIDIVKWDGPWQFFGLASRTEDEVLGQAYSFVGGVQYQRNGWSSNIVASRVDERFMPRLGYAQLRNYSGVNAYIQRQQTFRSGPISRMTYFVSSNEYRQLGTNDNYLSGYEFFVNAGLRNGVGASLEWSGKRFFETYDNFWSATINYPSGNPYRGVSVQYGQGRFADEPYRSVLALARYRPVQRLQLTLGAQWVEHYEKQTQIVGNFNYQINKYDAIGGRVVGSDDDWNAYISFRHSGGTGAEYFIILGDPNASEFKKSLILKLVMPIDIKF